MTSLSTPVAEPLARQEGRRDPGAVIEVSEVSVRFSGISALTDVSLSARPGEVTGLQQPTSGVVHVEDRDVSKLPPYKRARLGLARTFQRLEVFGSLTVYENVLAAAEFHHAWSDDDTPPRQVAAEIVARVGLSVVAESRVDSLPTGLARLVELGRALATRPRILLLDEVGSGLNHDETAALGDLMVELTRDGTAILLVEHDVELVMRVCDRIFVLDFGRIIAAGTPEQIQQDAAVQAAYLGAAEEVSA